MASAVAALFIQYAKAVTMTEPNKTLGIGFGVDLTRVENYQNRQYDLRFRPDFDFENAPKGGVFESDSNIKFVVVTVRDWNRINDILREASLQDMERHRFTIGASFRIRRDHISSKVMPPEFNEMRFFLRINDEYDPDRYDLVDMVRYGYHNLDEEAYPFVAITVYCWNNFQRLVDELDSLPERELNLRQTIRQDRPLAVPIPVTNVRWLTSGKSDEKSSN